MVSFGMNHSTRRWGRWIVGCGCALVLASTAAGSAAAGTHPHVRQGWLVGFGIGGGSAGVDVPGVDSDREGGFGGSLRAGYAFNQRISLELGGSAWTREENGVTVAFAATGPTLNYYPGEQGLVLRAGVGSGTGKASVQQGNVTVSTTEDGLGVFGGVGYEFRVTPRFALGPQINVGWMDLDSFNANWVNVELGFHWYFIRR